MPSVRTERLASPAPADDLAALADVLCACVEDGASVGFLRGLSAGEALAWWRDLLAEPGLECFVARDETGVVVGTVSLLLDQPETGRHRAEVTKLLVHPGARRRGAAVALMAAAEDGARAAGRTVLMLDTETGSTAEKVYRRLGWTEYGLLPDHAAAPDGHLTPSTFFAKHLDRPRGE